MTAGISRRCFMRDTSLFIAGALSAGCGSPSTRGDVSEKVYFLKATPEIFDGNLVNLQSAANELYRQHPNAQENDFLLVIPNFEVHNMPSGIGAWYTPVKNDAESIGLSVFDYSQGYGGRGKLRGIATVRNLQMLLGNPDPKGELLEQGISLLASHELSHAWLAYLGESGDGIAERSHYLQTFMNTGWTKKGNSDDSPDNYRRIVDPNGGSNRWLRVSGDQWRDVSCYDVETEHKFCALSLYLMGLMDAEEHDGNKYQGQPETGKLSKLVDVRGDPMQDTPCQFDMWGTEIPVTVQELARTFGTRYPTRSHSQKDFKLGVIALEGGREFSELEISVLNATTKSLPGIWSDLTGNRSSIYI